jgi:hypothetical protein
VSDLQGTDQARSVWTKLDDWLNPIVVKEVRQALRGKYFKIVFWITLLAVTVTCSAILVDMGDRISASGGRNFFLGAYFCLGGAVLAFVPFSAFIAMGSEWDENTYDLLIISNLKPRQIIFGKLLSTFVQALLFYSAFTPFIVSSFLLRGVDIVAVLVVLGGSMLMSLGLSVVAIFMSTLSRVRFARIVLMGALAVLLGFATFICIGMGVQLISQPNIVHGVDSRAGIATFALVVCVVAAFCFVIACNMISHYQENRSTGLRVLTTAVLVIGIAWIRYMLVTTSSGFPRSAVASMGITYVFIIAIPAIFFATERESLGIRVAPRVSPNGGLALLCAPFLPGGGRGMILFMLHIAMLLLACFALNLEVMTRTDNFWDKGLLSLVAGALYAIIYVSLPAGMFSSFTNRPVMRAAVRGFIPLLAMIFAFVPALFGFFIGDRGLTNMEHPGNPARIIGRVWSGEFMSMPGTWALIMALTLLALIVNLPRMFAGVYEVGAASRAVAKRARERAKLEAADAVTGS